MNDRPGAPPRLSFAQRHLGEPLPTQLDRNAMPELLRYRLWEVIAGSMAAFTRPDTPALGSSIPGLLYGPWSLIMLDFHKDYLIKPHDQFSAVGRTQRELLRLHLTSPDYRDVYGALDFILQHPACPNGVAEKINGVLQNTMAAWRVYDGTLLGPLASEHEALTLDQAFTALCTGEFEGARAHLRAAVANLSAGDFAASIRESISAVEGAAKSVEPNRGTLNDAMKKLVAAGKVSKLLSQGLEKLYAWTSDEKGLRHALVFEDKAHVDEADAIFMLGACAAFVTYLVSRSGP